MLIALLAMIAQVPPSSNEWVHYFDRPGHSRHFYAPTSIINIDVTWRRLWIRLELSTPVDGIASTETLTQVECRGRNAIRFMGRREFDAAGNLIRYVDPERYTTIIDIAGTRGNSYVALLERVCAGFVSPI